MESEIDNFNENEYLASVLMPSIGPKSIPDDNLRRHVCKQETITYNITAANDASTAMPVKGILVFYPNTPSSLIGVHYRYSNLNSIYVYDTSIFTAQQLASSYNYARKSAGILYVRSSTLPSGVYALSGTFNAATYEGAPSEVGLPDYNTVLRITNNPMDKAGNVLVGTGIAVLTLPASFDIPYMRLQDISPTTSAGLARIRDSQQNLIYTWTIPAGTPLTSSTLVTLGTMNSDSNTAVTVTANITINVVLAGSISAASLVYNFQFTALDLTGAAIAIIAQSQFTYNIASGQAAGTYTPGETIYGTLPVGNNFLGRPVAAIGFSYNLVSPGTVPTFATVTLGVLHVDVTSHSGAMPGTQYPVTIVAYEGVAAGTTISISGVANYELIPNPVLAQNIETYYGKPSQADMAYLKAVMARRDNLQLRTVQPIEDYKAAFGFYKELSNMHVGRTKFHIEAFDWGKLFQIGKQLLPAVVPAISDAIIPGSGGIASMLTNLGTSMISASGSPISASGSPIAAIEYPVAATGKPRRLNKKETKRIY